MSFFLWFHHYKCTFMNVNEFKTENGSRKITNCHIYDINKVKENRKKSLPFSFDIVSSTVIKRNHGTSNFFSFFYIPMFPYYYFVAFFTAQFTKIGRKNGKYLAGNCSISSLFWIMSLIAIGLHLKMENNSISCQQ